MKSLLKSLNTASTSELIAAEIRNSIVSGKYKIGQALKQDTLAAEFNVSKIPVREALSQLKTEGLVFFQSNRGTTVSSLSVDEVEEIYLMRMSLEAMALKKSIPRFSTSNKIAAESTLKLLDESDDPMDWARLNWRFHSTLYADANMPILLETVSRLHNNVARYLMLYLDEMNFQEESQKEHWELFNACNEKDTKRALKILKQHLGEALKQTTRYMSKRS